MDFITVTALNKYAKLLLDRDSVLNPIWVAGEVSSFVRNRSSGHCYFILKDDNAAVKAVMFRGNAEGVKFEIENGMSVLAFANVTIYERDGSFQLNVHQLEPRGVGAAYLELQKLKQTLEREGLFAPERKKPVPKFPASIAVVTSESGAALHDIINVISRRWQGTSLKLIPIPVQGREAAATIARAVGSIDSRGCEVAIIARGGGSSEDLSVFNNEAVVRSAAGCKTPIISAVGHETDFTLLDFVADLRAPTPSAAAELAVPEAQSVSEAANAVFGACRSTLDRRISAISSRLNMTLSCAQLADPVATILVRNQRSDAVFADISASLERRLALYRSRVELSAAGVQAQNPNDVFRRGYAAVEQDGRYITRASQADDSLPFTIKFYDGELNCIIQKEVDDERF